MNLSSQIAALGAEDVINLINELIVEFKIVQNNVVPVLLNSVVSYKFYICNESISSHSAWYMHHNNYTVNKT